MQMKRGKALCFHTKIEEIYSKSNQFKFYINNEFGMVQSK